jgi:hypothetical protein
MPPSPRGRRLRCQSSARREEREQRDPHHRGPWQPRADLPAGSSRGGEGEGGGGRWPRLGFRSRRPSRPRAERRGGLLYSLARVN